MVNINYFYTENLSDNHDELEYKLNVHILDNIKHFRFIEGMIEKEKEAYLAVMDTLRDSKFYSEYILNNVRFCP